MSDSLGLNFFGYGENATPREVVDPVNMGIRYLMEGKWRDVPSENHKMALYPRQYSLKWYGRATPTLPLPRIGGTATAKKDSALYERLRTFLKKARNMTQEEFLSAPKDLFKQVDRDYTLLKESLNTDREASGWFQRGYDIMPDFNEGRYVWVYTGVKKKSANARASSSRNLSAPLMLGQLEGEEEDKDLLAYKEVCAMVPSIVVDIFHNSKMLKSQEAMPLHWDRNIDEKTGKPYINFIQEAKEFTGLDRVVSLAVVIEESKPCKPIDWFEKTHYRGRVYGCRDIQYMQGQYVAIHLSDFGYGCAICENMALFANTVFMKSFCSEGCHTVFLSQLSV